MENLNVLIVEDESILALNLAAILQGFKVNVVDFVCSYDEALVALERHPEINLMIVDINLSDDSGIELVNSIKKSLEVIYLTAYSDEKTVESASKTLPLGYLLKPLNKEQLNILLKIATQKIKLKVDTKETIDLTHGYIFDGREEKLFYNNQAIKLSGKKLDLLKILIENRGNYIPFKDLEEQLYLSSPPSESALRTLVYRLRTKFNFDLVESEKFLGVKLKLD